MLFVLTTRGTPSRVAGIGFKKLGEDALKLHAMAFGSHFSAASPESVDAKAIPHPGRCWTLVPPVILRIVVTLEKF